MKRLEIIIPHRALKDVHEVLRDLNTGGMSYYKIEGSGKTKADPITIGRGTAKVHVSVFLGIALLIIGIEVIVVGVTGRRIHFLLSF